MGEVVIHAPQISTYGRVVAMVASEAGLPWRVQPTAAASRENPHPFRKTPTVDVDGLRLFESSAICQYLDDVHNAGALQPGDPVERARMQQWLSISNQYLFPTTEVGLVIPRLIAPATGGVVREEQVQRALPTIAYQLELITERLEEAPWLAGASVSLADLFAYCILRAVQLTPEGASMIASLLPLARWMAILSRRDSAMATRWPREPESA